MKKSKLILLIATAFIFITSCKDDDNNGGTDNDDVLTGAITSDRTLNASTAYILESTVTVEAGATLTIPAGTVITANLNDGLDVLIVKQGGKIEAIGSADNPIVFTSSPSEIGSWGGIVLLGKAPINVAGGTSSPEFDDSLTYGGTVPNDNSGTLAYVRVEYAGAALQEGSKEFNGFGFYAVGSETTLHHLETYKGSDDGFEWFGGTVVANNLISLGDEDDSFDTAEGWTGGGSNWIGIKVDTGDFGFEWDNNEFDNLAEPVSNPTVSNVTLVGTGAKSGMLLRRGAQGSITNVVIRNFGIGIEVRDDATVQNTINGNLTVTNVAFEAIVNENYVDDQEELDIPATAIIINAAAAGADDSFAAGWSKYAAEGWGN